MGHGETRKPYGEGVLVDHVSEKQEAITRCLKTTAGLISALAVCVRNLPAKLPVKEWLCGLDVEGHERLGWEE